jgi:hypothetical protein
VHTKTPLAPTKQRPFFRYDPYTTIAAIIGIFFIGQIAALFLVGLYPALVGMSEEAYVDWFENSPAAQFGVTLFVASFAVVSIWYVLKRAGIKLSRIGLIKPQTRDIFVAVGAYIAYFVSYFIIVLLASAFLPGLDVEQEQQIGFDTTTKGWTLLLPFISLVVLPPLWEEIVFRGFLFSSLRAKYRFVYTSIATSVLFGLVHLQFGADAPLLWIAAIDTFVLSFYLCFIREKTGSLWPAIYVHAFKNLLAFYLLFID